MPDTTGSRVLVLLYGQNVLCLAATAGMESVFFCAQEENPIRRLHTGMEFAENICQIRLEIVLDTLQPVCSLKYISK